MTLHVAQTVNTKQLQNYVPWNVVCFRYVIVNTLHIGDNKYNNNNNNNNNNATSIIQKINVTESMKEL